MSSIPPWRDINELFLTEFLPELGVEHMTNGQANGKFKRLMNTIFNKHLTIFTDGSKISFPSPSVSAAVIIPDANYAGKWKLPTNITVLGAELFAIKKALIYVKTNRHMLTNVVIFTDFLSSMYLFL